MDQQFKSGFVTVIGRPNVGKSTMMNTIIGQKIAITSSKPQTTRNRIQSVLTSEEGQIIFIDTPGIHKPKSKLGEFMNKSAMVTLKEVDVVLLLIEPDKRIGKGDQFIIDHLEGLKTPVILVINKTDTVPHTQILEVMAAYKDAYAFDAIVPVSALNNDNLDDLIKTIFGKLEAGPMYFPADMITDQPERQLAAELIREKALRLLQEEIPHGIAVVIDSMVERDDKEIFDIDATIICERDSHKGIIIGKQGAMLKQIGTFAREDMEALLGCKVNLQLWVKVKERWRDSDFLLRNYGFDKKEL